MSSRCWIALQTAALLLALSRRSARSRSVAALTATSLAYSRGTSTSPPISITGVRETQPPGDRRMRDPAHANPGIREYTVGAIMSQNSVSAGTRGGGITILGSTAAVGIQFASVFVLSRLLTPEDFGLVAMVSIFIALAYLIKDFGLPMAALQAPTLSHQQASNMFWLNTAMALGSAVILTLCAPLVAGVFDEPRLIAIIPAMAMVIVVSGAGAQIQVDLARRMRYPAIVGSDITGQISGLAVAIALAIVGLGYWALVAQAAAAATVTLTIRWFISAWRPARFRRGHGSADLFRTGSEYGLAQMLTFAQNNVDTLVIGSTLGATPLGYYNRGYQLLTAPAGKLLDPLTQVVVPMLNAARAEGRDYQPLLLRIQFAVGTGMGWIFAMAAGSAAVLIPILLGPGWEATVPVFQILAIGGCFMALSTVSYWAFVHNEQSRELLRYNLVSKPLAVVCILVGSLFGLVGVAAGYAVAMAVSWPLNLWWLNRSAGLRATAFASNGLIIAACAGLGGTIALATAAGLGATLSPFAALVASLVAGSLTMLLALVTLPRTRAQLIDSTRLVRVLARRPEKQID